MKLSIIVIGDEILLGQVTDTNSGFISRTLGAYGWETVRIMTVADKADDIRHAIETCMEDSNLVITTGGLGPTKDDITKPLLCEIFGGPMIFDETVAENIREVFDKRGLKLNPLTEAQAMVPQSCKVIQNRLGTAPIMWFERRDGHVLIAMPGVPFETEGMLVSSVAPMIAERFTPDEFIGHRVLMITDITESALAQRLERFEAELPEGMHLAYLPTPGLIRLRLDAIGNCGTIGERHLDEAYRQLCEETAPYIIFKGDATAAEIALDAVRRHGWKITSAESCTGGDIAHTITMISGCSDVYVGSVVSYANEIKSGVLGVPPELIERHGAVSQEVVTAMVEGVARLMNAECAVATSGIAGPGGGSDEKPVGTVWTAVHTPDGTEAFVKRYPGNRSRVIDRATTEALLALAKKINRRP
ncbi:MAG: CinA family nicotinamide mononucleotide deamidase-related protein [Muribaculaceae bacterium]|nr:CinA family nicotinamide mononucleotide deamidase-related protein [Muribaculaceae bacterium]